MNLTAEEFIREKVRSKYEVQGEMKALHTYYITGEEALRWAHEFASLDKVEIWNDACRKTLSDISDTFLSEDNLKKADSQSDKDVFIALGETIKNFPLPRPKATWIIQVSNANINPGQSDILIY